MFGAKLFATTTTSVFLTGFHTKLFKQPMALCEDKKPSESA